MYSFAPHAPANPAKSWMQFNGGKSKEQWESEKLFKIIRTLMPDIVVNNRADYKGDVFTPEQVQPEEWMRDSESGEYKVWESCQTFSGSWGYARDEYTWKSPKMLIDMLIKNVARGGNMIMNVGPNARGCVDKRANNALSAFGEWMKYNSRSICGCTMAEPEFTEPHGASLTQSTDGSRLYLFLTEYPFKSIKLKNLADKIDYAQFLHDGSELLFTDGKLGRLAGDNVGLDPENKLIIKLPAVKPDILVPTIELFLK